MTTQDVFVGQCHENGTTAVCQDSDYRFIGLYRRHGELESSDDAEGVFCGIAAPVHREMTGLVRIDKRMCQRMSSGGRVVLLCPFNIKNVDKGLVAANSVEVPRKRTAFADVIFPLPGSFLPSNFSCFSVFPLYTIHANYIFAIFANRFPSHRLPRSCRQRERWPLTPLRSSADTCLS